MWKSASDQCRYALFIRRTVKGSFIRANDNGMVFVDKKMLFCMKQGPDELVGRDKIIETGRYSSAALSVYLPMGLLLSMKLTKNVILIRLSPLI